MAKSGRPKVSIKLPKRVQLDERTRFYIDYDWWHESGLSIESYLTSRLGHDIDINQDTGAIDLIDSESGEVRQLSGFEYAVQAHFNALSNDMLGRGSLVDAVFTVLLANGNQPMSAGDIAAYVRRDAETIIRTFGGQRIYQGIRPYYG